MSTILAVSLSPRHGFSKVPQSSIRLLTGLGVEGDAHCGATVQHVYLKRKNATAPNRMQVHLLQSELFCDLLSAGQPLAPGQLGENVTTAGIDLLRLPLGTCLRLGAEAVVELTGLRTPCRQIEAFQPGLLKELLDGNAPPKRRGKAGVMAIVLRGGICHPGDPIRAILPGGPHLPLNQM